jgi:hypothetical protein
MKFKVVQIGRPVLSAVRQIQAVSDNEIAVSFPEPADVKLAISQILNIDLEAIGADQSVIHPTTGQSMSLNIPESDVHDLRLPMRHGISRFPVEARRRGQ